MDRTYWVETNDFLPGEKVVAQQVTVRLYDGEDKVLCVHGIRFLINDHPKTILSIPQTTFDGGTLQLTTHRIIWDDEDQEVCMLLVQLDIPGVVYRPMGSSPYVPPTH